MNVEGTTYGKRWKRHEWIQLVEAQAIDNPETEKVVLAIHGGGIDGGTEIRAMVCVNVAATGEGAPMADTYDVILRLVQNVQKDEASIGVLSTGERLAVALVLDRKDLLDEFGYTMLGAADRVGQDWLKAALKVQRDWF